ncbi:flavin-dependent oxidoreductase [Herbiconiux sp.]|uniref:flavin-dependent oxidoreductase n=1 Tax=Herbiconiux sp. TaxID=1871186 RepID=UPI0025BE304A|nr:flavin-dependent oxidoreductase [Herbiconiux sp.]
MKIVVVGAGIGGLATALSLDAAGFRDIEVYERADELRGLGVGINLLPHAVRELTELGIVQRISTLGVEPTSLAYFNAQGQPIWSEPRGLAAGYRWPQLSVHRGRLQLALRDAVLERLGDVIRTGHRLLEVVPGEDADTARFETAAGVVEVAADVIVGADGIHSSLRAQHNPEEGAPAWGGLTLWRGVAYAPPFLDGRTMIMAGHGDQKFVAYPLGEADESGRMRINFIAEKRGAGTASVDWNRAVEIGPIAELFADWRYDWLDVPALISSAEELLEYPMVDRDPLERWTVGRSTLLGDAAHAMYPNGSNGGSQAIIDSRVLAFHLGTAATASEGLAAYEADRRPATAALLAQTREAGPEKVMVLAEQRAPGGFEHIHDVIGADELERVATDYKKAAGFHPALLNERASLTVSRAAEARG